MLFIASDDKTCGYKYVDSGTDATCMLGFKTELKNQSCSCTVLFSLFVLGVGRGIVYASTLVLGANQILDSNYIAVFVHGHYFSFELGCVLIYVVYGFVKETTNNSVLFIGVGAGACFLSFGSFLAGSRFYQPEHTNHLVDTFMQMLKAVSVHFYFNFKIFPNQDENKG